MIPIIRAFWGSQDTLWNEVPQAPIFSEELVIVWGVENEEKFKALGYKTYLSCKTETDPIYSTIWDHFVHKLLALKIAEELYREYLFLDWDVKIIKELDFNFWNKIRSGKSVQCPIYAYPSDYNLKVFEMFDSSEKEWDSNLKIWIEKQYETLLNYSWKSDDLLVVPNFCFFYSRDAEVMDNLIHIYKKLEIKTCIEEFCMFVWANSSLDDYILKYEPLVIDGRPDEYSHFDMNLDSSKSINNYVRKFKSKDIYLKHL